MNKVSNIFKVNLKDVFYFIALLFLLFIEVIFAEHIVYLLYFKYKVFGTSRIAAQISSDVSYLLIIFLSILLILLIKKLHKESSLLIFMICTGFMWIKMSLIFREVNYSYGGAVSNIAPMYSLMMMYVTQDLILMKSEPERHIMRIIYVVGFTIFCTILHFTLHFLINI